MDVCKDVVYLIKYLIALKIVKYFLSYVLISCLEMSSISIEMFLSAY